MKKPTARKGAKGDVAEKTLNTMRMVGPPQRIKNVPPRPGQPFRVADPSSGEQMMKGRPVENAGPTKPVPRVKDPNTGQPMEKGKPVPTAYSGALNQKIGLNLDAAGRALGAGFKPPALTPKGAEGVKGDGMLLKKPVKRKK